MQQYKAFSILVEELQSLVRQEQEHKSDVFNSFIEDLNFVYQRERESLADEFITPFIKQHSYLVTESVLQTIRKHDYENYHSLLLKYVWGNKSFGRDALCAFIEQVPDIKDKDALLSKIKESRTFIIEEEHMITKARKRSLNGKRIDLLITGDDWVVVIENKINSKVSFDKARNRSQLESYKRYCDDSFPFKERTYILLSHANNKDAIVENEQWGYADYYMIFNSLLAYSADMVTNDYLRTLFALLFNDTLIDDAGEDDGEHLPSLHQTLEFYDRIITNTAKYALTKRNRY